MAETTHDLLNGYAMRLTAWKRDGERRRGALMTWHYSPWGLAMWAVGALAAWAGGVLLAWWAGAPDWRLPALVGLVLSPLPLIILPLVRGAVRVEADRLYQQWQSYYDPDPPPDPPTLPKDTGTGVPGEGVLREMTITDSGGTRRVTALSAAEAEDSAWRKAALDFVEAWHRVGSVTIRAMTESGAVSDPDWRAMTDLLAGVGVLYKAGRRTHPLMTFGQARERLRTSALPHPRGPPPRVVIPAHRPHTPQGPQATQAGGVS